jgi:hypothetical protein
MYIYKMIFFNKPLDNTKKLENIQQEYNKLINKIIYEQDSLKIYTSILSKIDKIKQNTMFNTEEIIYLIDNSKKRIKQMQKQLLKILKKYQKILKKCIKYNINL